MARFGKYWINGYFIGSAIKINKTWSDEIRNETINKLHIEFKIWQNVVVSDELVEYTEITYSSSTPFFMKKIFSNSLSQTNNEIEIDNYLNKTITPVLPEVTDIYQ